MSTNNTNGMSKISNETVTPEYYRVISTRGNVDDISNEAHGYDKNVKNFSMDRLQHKFEVSSLACMSDISVEISRLRFGN